MAQPAAGRLAAGAALLVDGVGERRCEFAERPEPVGDRREIGPRLCADELGDDVVEAIPELTGTGTVPPGRSS